MIWTEDSQNEDSALPGSSMEAVKHTTRHDLDAVTTAEREHAYRKQKLLKKYKSVVKNRQHQDDHFMYWSAKVMVERGRGADSLKLMDSEASPTLVSKILACFCARLKFCVDNIEAARIFLPFHAQRPRQPPTRCLS